MSEDAMDLALRALAHASRRQMLDLVRQRPGSSVNDISKYFDMSRIAVMKHLNVLEEAGLLISRKTGRVRELYFNAVPIQEIYDRWTTDYSEFFATQVVDLKRNLERRTSRRKVKQP